MTFYQNVFDEFRDSWVLSDRQYSIDFICPSNINRSDCSVAWNTEPYNLSVNNTLTLNYAWDLNYRNYSALAINIAGVVPSATLASEVVALLNANAIFADMFTAQLQPLPQTGVGPPPNRVLILKKPQRVKPNIRLYISNDGANLALGFNNKTGVADMPNYMDRFTIANRFNFPDCVSTLVRLSFTVTGISIANPTVITSTGHGLSTGNTVIIYGSNSTPTVNGTYAVTVIDANTFTVPVNVTGAGTLAWFTTPATDAVIRAAGLNPANMKQDWQLLSGRASGLFTFHNITVDGSDRITQIIEYPAGAVAGAFGRKINYTYTGANTHPSTITEIPYVVQAADLITP